jgi:hypothetical protein
MYHFQISAQRRNEEGKGLSARDPALKQCLTNSFAMMTAARLRKTLIFWPLEHWETPMCRSGNRVTDHRSGERDRLDGDFLAVLTSGTTLTLDQPPVALPSPTCTN